MGNWLVPLRQARKARRTAQAGRKRTCPGWLLAKYRAFSPRYAFYNGMGRGAALERVYWSPQTKEFVAVYLNQVYDIEDTSDRCIERYTWVWRGNKMVELHQSGVACGWRSRKPGWTS